MRGLNRFFMLERKRRKKRVLFLIAARIEVIARFKSNLRHTASQSKSGAIKRVESRLNYFA